MTERMFRLLELHQKLDAALRRMKATRTADPLAIARMTTRKLRLKDALARLVAPGQPVTLPFPA
ncbi:YdcH family protein [Novosphingobium guangzhouense]|uniref:DUF465 domain-containing protein n=1 Tax=Novosphingobium guangzhouense TaxID=1850347 RepID=A0A2K2FUT3_9SPHN|nr:YdcH family protein [Novosphingobium guangzhouense]PNU02555.1 hypothetical protein A8V01_09270 [Novosphingobium guangzhouense]